MVTISVVIPAFNEENHIKDTLEIVRSRAEGIHEYIVAVGGTDKTANIARKAGATVVEGGLRSVALNVGARVATGNVIYFLHADTTPPMGWDKLISNEYESGNSSGSFRLSFDTNKLILRFFSWFTRFSWSIARFGDQSLYVSRTVFQDIGGYNENLSVMEDNDIVRRLKKVSTHSVIQKKVITSARKYEQHGAYKLQLIYVLVTILYYCGLSQARILSIYKTLLEY
jgi:rSAM/selenodomain-associated transferase 2